MANGTNLRPLPSYDPSSGARPANIGIHALDIYFPKRGVNQTELEKFDGVSAGKYTIGLGQAQMAFCDDREDIHSFLLTVTSSLLRKYNIDPKTVGRLDVGTETLVDKSKSAKTVLMDLFTASGNSDIEGIDSKNACYGGTAALFNACNWIESSNWDGRWAVVVAGDIAIYAAGGARPVGGAGAVAMLVGPDAPLVLENVHGSHMANVYDFYKPHLLSEYPEVDGPLTQVSYPGALEKCYDHFRTKEVKRLSRATKANGVNGVNGHAEDLSKVTVKDFDFFAMHSPYGKLVQKSYARLLYNDYLSNKTDPAFAEVDAALGELPREKTLLNKDVEKAFVALSKDLYAKRVAPCMATSSNIGNMYTASLYGSLASLLDSTPSETLQGKRIGMYSYGSGLAASMFSLRVNGSTEEMQKALDLSARIAAMDSRPPAEYDASLSLREETHHIADHSPKGLIENVWVGAYYLVHCDAKHRRTYAIREA